MALDPAKLGIAAAKGLATCVIRWLYEAAAAVLKILKNFLNSMIAFLDAQVKLLRALLAQLDLLAKGEEIIWNLVKGIIDGIKSQFLTLPEGPAAAICAEFYNDYLEPAKGLLDAITAGLSVYRQKYLGIISFMDEVDTLISYWDNIKNLMGATVEVLDDALLIAMEREAVAFIEEA